MHTDTYTAHTKCPFKQRNALTNRTRSVRPSAPLLGNRSHAGARHAARVYTHTNTYTFTAHRHSLTSKVQRNDAARACASLLNMERGQRDDDAPKPPPPPPNRTEPKRLDRPTGDVQNQFDRAIRGKECTHAMQRRGRSDADRPGQTQAHARDRAKIAHTHTYTQRRILVHARTHARMAMQAMLAEEDARSRVLNAATNEMIDCNVNSNSFLFARLRVCTFACGLIQTAGRKRQMLINID